MSEHRLEEGEVRTVERSFTNEEVREFADLSKDEGYHHLAAEGDGRLVVHGLLTATLPTKIGGDMDYVARAMTFEFPRPVYTGETIACAVTVERVAETDGRTELSATYEATNEDGEVVLHGNTEGVVFG